MSDIQETNGKLALYESENGEFWYNRFINYQGLIGRWKMEGPNYDFMSVFAEKKARVMVQNAKFTFAENWDKYKEIDNIKQLVENFLNEFDLLQLFNDCIQQASMNGYAVLDLERVVWNRTIKSYVFVNPFPSVYDQYNFLTLSDKCNELVFQTCLNTQRYKTPNVTLFKKNGKQFNIFNIGGLESSTGLLGVTAGQSMDEIANVNDFYYKNKLQDKIISYEQLYYRGNRIGPYLDENRVSFYVFRNRPFTLGYKNFMQNSDMWFLGQMGHLIISALERVYQEQEQDITRVLGSFDPQLMDATTQQSSVNEMHLNVSKENSGSVQRAMKFTAGDGQTINQAPTSFNGPLEIQTLKDWFDVAFKLAVGFDLFGESATRESTATENLQRSIAERENIIVLTNFYKKQMKEFFCDVLFFEFGNDFKDCGDIAIENQRGQVTPTEIQSILALYSNGLMSLDLALKKLNPNMNQMELDEEYQKVSAMQMQQQQASSLQDVSQTALMNQESQNNNEQQR